MKHNFHEYPRDGVERWAMSVLLAATKETRTGYIDPENIDITLTVEGAEVDVMYLVQRASANKEELAENMARDMLTDAVDELMEGIDLALDEARNKIRLLPQKEE